jgi:hypothetical protein
MRFACQSCGKAYNLPDEKIADKSNVKLKCRVCGAIVEVKKQGEVVAQILGDGDSKRGRVSEAPPAFASLQPEDMLTSMSADDSDDATHAIAVGDQILSEGGSGDDAASALLGHVKSTLAQRGLAPLPPPSPTGFAPTPVPPPLELPRPEPPLPRPEAAAPPLPTGFGAGPGAPPPPLPSPLPGSPQNGSNGAVPRFGDMMPMPDEPFPPLPMAMSSATMSSGGMSSGGMSSGGMSSGGMSATGLAAPALSHGAMTPATPSSMDMGGFGAQLDAPPAPQPGDSTRKMLAALATGILIGFIIARLFF